MGVLQYFDQFYEDKAKDEVLPKVGDIWWVPTAETNEVPRIFDATRVDSQGHNITDFEITDIKQVHFTKRSRLPIKLLTLQETEELLIAKAKRRPCIILASNSVNDLDKIQSSTQKRLAGTLCKATYLVAPLYSVSTITDPGTFGPEMIGRIRAMHYPHLFCLPEIDNKENPKSIVRLDRVFPTYLQKGCAYFGKRLTEEPLAVLLSQFSHLTGGKGNEEFLLVKELVEESYDLSAPR